MNNTNTTQLLAKQKKYVLKKLMKQTENEYTSNFCARYQDPIANLYGSNLAQIRYKYTTEEKELYEPKLPKPKSRGHRRNPMMNST